MSDAKVRIAVLGVGSWANRVQIPQVLSHPRAQLVALAARTPEKLRAAGEQFGVSALYQDYEQLLAREDLDAVCISSTHSAHYPMARAALERGLHVFCEKPLGMNSAQTGELAALAEAKGLKTMVAFTNRWVPEALYARRLIAEGYVGEPFHYNVCQLAAYGRPGGEWMWRADAALGGGVLYDLGCHNIDLALWLNGPIRAVCALRRNTVPARRRGEAMLATTTADTDAFVAEFANGCQGLFHISWTSPGGRIMRHELAGRDGLLALDLYHDEWDNHLRGCRAGERALQPLVVPDDLQGAIPRAVATPQERSAAHDAFLRNHPSLVRAFVDCLVNDTAPSPSFADGHATQQVMDAVVISDRERRWAEVGEVLED